MGKLAFIPISLLLIIASPYVLWKAESQNHASDFEDAIEVEQDSTESGYIRTKGKPEAEETLACPKDETKNCLHVVATLEECTKTQQDVCTSIKPTDTIIETLAPSCDETNNCTPCYRTEKTAWVVKETKTQSVKFKIGKYLVPSLTKANLIGKENYTKYLTQTATTTTKTEEELIEEYFYAPASYAAQTPTSEQTPKAGDKRMQYEYLEGDKETIVVGNVENNEVSKKDKEFIVSTLSSSETLDKLESQDNTNQWVLRILSFFMMTGGFSMLFSGIVALPLALVNIIPGIGDDISKFAKGMVSSVAGAIGTALWIIIFIITTLLKSTLALVVSLGLIILVCFLLWLRAQSKKKVTPAKTE